MSIRSMLTEAILPALRELCPGAGPEDILFFGPHADVSSPLPLKYGVDISEDMVYNFMNMVAFCGSPLFSHTRINGGYIDLTFSDEALNALAGLFEGVKPFLPREPFEHGRDPYSLSARLLWAAEISCGFQVPRDPVYRRAFLFCLLADTESSRARALSLSEEALKKTRLASLEGAETLSGGAAKCMAAAMLGLPRV